MIKFSKQSDYALQLLCALGKQTGGSALSIKSFAVESSISFLFLQKIAARLRDAGFISAELGRCGGYRLLRTLKDISIKQVITAVEGSTGVSACTRNGHCSKQGRCELENGMRRINIALDKQLQEIKIADLV